MGQSRQLWQLCQMTRRTKRSETRLGSSRKACLSYSQPLDKRPPYGNVLDECLAAALGRSGCGDIRPPWQNLCTLFCLGALRPDASTLLSSEVPFPIRGQCFWNAATAIPGYTRSEGLCERTTNHTMTDSLHVKSCMLQPVRGTWHTARQQPHHVSLACLEMTASMECLVSAVMLLRECLLHRQEFS